LLKIKECQDKFDGYSDANFKLSNTLGDRDSLLFTADIKRKEFRKF